MNYDEFRKEWLSRHRMSLPKRERVLGVMEGFWIVFWVVVALAGAAFSGVHTIPAAELTILSDVEHRRELAMTVFVIVELVIFGAAANRKAIDWLKWLLLAALTVALISNVSSSIRAVNANDDGNLTSQISGLLQSVLAPLTAFAAGEVLHYQLGLRAQKKKKADEDFTEAWGSVEAKISTAFTKYVREHDGELPSRASTVQLSNERPLDTSTGQSLIPAASRLGHDRVPDASKRVQEFYAQNQDALWDKQYGVRKVADLLGVGRQTVSNVRAQLRQQAKASNGHTEPQNERH